jgi:hypothetical protein
MKIQLERKLESQSHQLCCVACKQKFGSEKLRTLLSDDWGSIIGDLCTDCLSKGTQHIQDQLKAKSSELFQQSLTEHEDRAIAIYRQALELSELAAQDLKIPPFYYRWWKHLTIFVADTQDLEIARRKAAIRSSSLR